MKYINTFFFLFGYITILSQNNLINNASFEDNDLDEPDAPCKTSQLENSQVWEDDHNFIFLPSTLPCNYLPCDNACSPCAQLHSPDWFDNRLGFKNFSEKIGSGPGSTNIIVTNHARSGNRFVGVRTGEIFEQKFFNANPLVGGKKYTFSMYVKIPNELTQTLTQIGLGYIEKLFDFDYDMSSIFQLNIYLSTQKIKYYNTLPTCNSLTWHDNFKDLTINNITQIKNFQISPLNYPYSQWHKLTFEFVCPTNHNYDWIGIEQSHDPSNSKNNGYILIDDVSLVESCEIGCYPTSGKVDPHIGIPSAYNIPLEVSNLNNIEKLTLEIFPITGGAAIYTDFYEYTNGIPSSIYWNGEANVFGGVGGGGSAATGVYICKLTGENECGPFTFTQNFVNVGSYAPYATHIPRYNIEDRDINPCCVIDYNINNRLFNSFKNYQVKENIYVSSNVNLTNTANVELIAGKNIEFIDEFEVASSAEFSAKIVPCLDAHRYSNDVLNDEDFVFFEQTENQAQKKILTNEKNINLTIIPNPTTGIFKLQANSNLEYPKQITIHNILGQTIFNIENPNSFDFEFNLQEQNAGIYMINVYYSNEVISKRIIKE